MSAINSNLNSNSDIESEKSENINNISDSTSTSTTFEFIEGSLSNENFDNFNVRTRPIWSSTKEEKQKHNEEIVMESANCDANVCSWEKIEIDEIQRELDEELDVCRNFLMNEKVFSSNENSRPTISSSSKPCFIDASSLLDDADDYMPPPTSFNTTSSPHRFINESSSSAPFNRIDNIIGDDRISTTENIQKPSHDIKDQFSASQPYHIPRNFRTTNTREIYTGGFGENSNSKDHHQQHERHQGQMIFHQSSLPPHSRQIICNDDYSSDVSFPSEYSSGSTCGTSGTFNNNLAFENTSGYGSTNYSTRLQSDVDSITMPDTPFNSIVQVAKKLEVCALGNSDENLASLKDYQRSTSSPVQIPKRLMKHDESAPILSGGASVKDFIPKHCESPAVRRKTDSCPIVSGGSLDIEEPVLKPLKSAAEKERSSFTWVVDLKNDLKLEDAEESDRKEDDDRLFPKSSSSCGTPKNSFGFYVDFNSLEPVPEVAPKLKSGNLRKQSLKKSTGFYVDFSSSDISCPNTPKQTIKEEELRITERRGSTESNDSKNNMFNMFVDFENSENPKSVAAKQKEEHNECERAGEMISSNNSFTATNITSSTTTTTFKLQQASEAAGGAKKGCFMFIENDSHVVKHRKNVPKEEASKRHSWNVNQTIEFDDVKTSSKVYQRSTSVSNDDDKMVPSSLPTIASKTSSMSIGSSLSPHEDFSCSKSLSSRSNLTISTSNTSVDNSETKVQFDDAEKKLMRKRRKEAKINETYDKSSQGSITDEIFSINEMNTASSSSDTDDVTFQNPKEYEEESEIAGLKLEPTSLLDEIKTKMDTIVETSENSSPFKRANIEKCVDNNEPKIEQHAMHTMESLQQLIEKQKQILETATEPTSLSFVKLSDLDKPPNKKEYPLMTSSAGFRVSCLMDSQRNQSMSRSTGTNMVNLASSVENSKSLSRLFPHLSKGIVE